MTREQYEAAAIRLSPKLLRAATRMAYPDHALAEDLVQSALVRGYEMMLAGKFEVGPAALSWFVRGMSTEFLAHLRKHRRCQTVEPEHHLLLNHVDPTTLENPLLSETMSENIVLALETLPADQRTCLELIDLADCSYQEVAILLRVPVGTVRSRLSRARLSVASHLSQGEASR